MSGEDLSRAQQTAEDALRRLKRNGCLACQGYLFRHAVPVAAFEGLLLPQ